MIEIRLTGSLETDAQAVSGLLMAIVKALTDQRLTSTLVRAHITHPSAEPVTVQFRASGLVVSPFKGSSRPTVAALDDVRTQEH